MYTKASIAPYLIMELIPILKKYIKMKITAAIEVVKNGKPVYKAYKNTIWQ